MMTNAKALDRPHQSDPNALQGLSPGELLGVFKSLFDPLPSGVAYCSIEQVAQGPVDFTYLYTNPAFHVQTGLGAVVGKQVSQIVPGIQQSDPWLLELYNRVATTGESESFECYIDALHQWYSVQVTSPQRGFFLALFKVENERKQAQEALRQSEARFRGLVAQNHAIILQVEPQTGQIIDANPAAQTFYGWSHETLCTKTIQDINVLEPEQVALELQAALAEKRKYFVFPHRLASGEIRSVEVHSTPVVIDNKPILVSIVHDITPKVEAEQRAKQMLAEQRAILNSEIVGIVKLNDRKFEWMNPPFARMLGYTVDELLHQPTRLLYSSDQAYSDFASLAYPAMQSGKAFHTEWQYLHKDGNPRWYEISGAYLFPGSGESIWSFQDVSERRGSRELLEKLFSEQKAMLNNEVVGIVKVRDRKIQWANLAFEEMLGYSHVELLGTAIGDHFKSKKTYAAFIDKAAPIIASGAVFRGQAEFARKDGEHIWVNLSGSHLDAQKGESLWSILDVSEQKLLHERLARSNDEVTDLYENSPCAYHSLDADGYYQRINDTELKWLGCQREEVIRRRKPTDFFTPSSKEYFERSYPKFLRDGHMDNLELELIGRTGEHRWVSMAATSLRTQDGTFVMSRSVMYDITKIKQLEDIRHEVLQRLQKIASRVPGMVYQYRMYSDGRSCFPFASDAIREIYRVSPEEVVHDATPVFGVLHPEDFAEVTASIHKSASDLIPWQLEYRVQFPEGAVRWLYGNAVPEREADGATLWHGFITDITERRQADDQLRKLSTAVEQSPASIVITDLQANIEYVNPRFSTATGYLATEVIGQNPRIVQSKLTPAQTYLQMWEALTSGKTWAGELINKRKNGELYWEESHIAPVKDGKGKVTHYVAVKNDITDRVRGAEKLEHLMRQQQAMLNNDLVGIVTVKDRHIVWANSAFEKMLGYASGELNGTPTRQNYTCENSYEAFGAVAYPVLEGGGVFRAQIEHRRKDGIPIWVDIGGELLSRSSGESIWGFVDITERKAAESRLMQSEAKIKGVIEGAADAIFLTDLAGHYQYANQEASRLLGYSRDEFVSMSVSDITPDEDLETVKKQLQELLTSKSLRTELRLRHKDGTLIPVELNASLLPDESVFGSCRDISLRKKMEEQVQKFAFHDTLTNLPNRRLLTDRLGRILMMSKRSGKYAALLFMDLDNFKPLNDLHGHEVGDLLLVEVASRLKSCVREIDTVARFGGDEFVVMLGELHSDFTSSKGLAAAIAEKIRAALAETYRLTVRHDEHKDVLVEHHCTASIGVALFGQHDVAQDDILKWSDLAMYQAKDAGGNIVRFFELTPQ